jgi:hypothetical protein
MHSRLRQPTLSARSPAAGIRPTSCTPRWAEFHFQDIMISPPGLLPFQDYFLTDSSCNESSCFVCSINTDCPCDTRWSLGSALFLASWAAMMGPWNYVSHLMSTPRLPFTAAYFGSIALTLYFSLGVSTFAAFLLTPRKARSVALVPLLN